MQRDPVIIIGAGPSGLMMACQLIRHGVPCRILDKLEEPIQTSNALAVQVRSLEIFHDIGIVDKAIEQGNKIHGLNLYAGKDKIAHIALNKIKSAYQYILGLPQQRTEELLYKYLQQHQVSIERGVELTEISVKENEAQFTYKNKDQIKHVTTQWLIACDGAHSYIREQLNINFTGEKLTQHFIMADLTVEANINYNEVHSFFTDQGSVAFLPLSYHFGRLICEVTHHKTLKNSKKPALADFKTILEERKLPIQFELKDPIWTSGFWIHNRIIEHYRHQCVFFVGDSAHIHSPVGGQGMNTGMQDAYNLAWKLALVIKNKCEPELLDTYEKERRPIAKQVLAQTKAATKMVTLQNPILRKIRNILLKVITSHPNYQTRIANTISQLDIKYNTSSICQQQIKQATTRFKVGPKPGERMPYLREWQEKLKSTRFQLLLFVKNTDDNECQQILKLIENHLSGLIEVHIIDKQKKNRLIRRRFAATKPCLYLIRPDKYISFRMQPICANTFKQHLAQLTLRLHEADNTV